MTVRLPGRSEPVPIVAIARWSIVCLFAVAIGCLAAAPLLMPEDYSWLEHTTSHAAGQGLEGAWLARAGFLAFGFAVLASLVTGRWWGGAARAVHVVFAVSMVAVAAYSSRAADPAIPYVASEDLLHSVFATLMGFAFAGGVALTAYRRVMLKAHVTVLDVLAVVASVVLPLIMWQIPDIAGVAQRLMFAIAFAWYITVTVSRGPRANGVSASAVDLGVVRTVTTRQGGDRR